MDQLLQFLKPQVVTAMALAPILLQLLRSKVPTFTAAHAGVANFLVVAGLTAWAMRGELSPFHWGELGIYVAQVAVAWLLSDVWFRFAVAPVSNSSNPVLPKA